jgi:hypothetical protein
VGRAVDRICYALVMAPLNLVPNDLAMGIRLAHTVEVLVGNLLLGLIVAWLLGPPSALRPRSVPGHVAPKLWHELRSAVPPVTSGPEPIRVHRWAKERWTASVACPTAATSYVGGHGAGHSCSIRSIR